MYIVFVSSILPWLLLNRTRGALQMNSTLGCTLTHHRHHWMRLSVSELAWNKNHCIRIEQTLQKWSLGQYPLWQYRSCQWHLSLTLHPFPVTKVKLESWFHSVPQIKQLYDLDTMVLSGEVSQVLIGCGRLTAVPLQCFLHPSVMCWAHTQG